MSSTHIYIGAGGNGTSGSASLTIAGEAGAESSFPRTDADALVRSITRAAEYGDKLAFAAAARRLEGGLAAAQAIVREKGIVRMADRVTVTRAADVTGGPELRDATSGTVDGGDTGPTMFGHFAVFNEWTEIDSIFEGNFLERVAPGAFKKTFSENRSEIRSLFQHGFDPQIGDKPLGAIADLREDKTGAYYEVDLLDAGYVREDILPGLKANLYGASFRFQMMREQFDAEPDPADHNPKGLPERTLKELRVYEFGPVTFPAYPSATASARSEDDPGDPPAPVDGDADPEAHPARNAAPSSAATSPTARRGHDYLNTRTEDSPSWQI